jgi:hypothetical protein
MILLTPLVVPAKTPPMNPMIGMPLEVPAYIYYMNCFGFPIRFNPPRHPTMIYITYFFVIELMCKALTGSSI